jgi:hypothetical protein
VNSLPTVTEHCILAIVNLSPQCPPPLSRRGLKLPCATGAKCDALRPARAAGRGFLYLTHLDPALVGELFCASAPRFAPAAPSSRQPFGHELVTERSAIANNHPQLSTVLVLVAPRCCQLERPRIQQLAKPVFRSVTKGALTLALRFTDFRRIDISDADLHAIHPDRVAIDDACRSQRAVADGEASRFLNN